MCVAAVSGGVQSTPTWKAVLCRTVMSEVCRTTTCREKFDPEKNGVQFRPSKPYDKTKIGKSCTCKLFIDSADDVIIGSKYLEYIFKIKILNNN
jgi:hypothetical protein